MSKQQGISPKLPLVYSPKFGPYDLNTTVRAAIKQNFKNLVLTIPGERVMLPEFGVGLYTFLFDNLSDDTFSRAASRITEQAKIYMPVINVESIDFVTSDQVSTLSHNQVEVVVKYNILPYNGSDELRITSLNN
tara:strand:- start:1911 stop:2312 length:402 start_codon:yes stop_codon:yes gene_type:complete